MLGTRFPILSGVRLLVNDGEKKAIISGNDISDLTYLALFNLSDTLSQDLEVRLTDLGSLGNVKITNMWSGEEIGIFNDVLTENLSPHASGLYKIEDAR